MRNLEDLLQDVGGTGLAQVLAVIFTNLPRLPMGWTMLEMSFGNFVPKWCCQPDLNVTVSHDLTYTNVSMSHDFTCLNMASYSKHCHPQNLTSGTCSRKLFQPGVRTVVNEWDLVCERKWVVPLTTSLQMAGVLVGASVAGQLADLWGRRRILFVNAFMCGVFNIISGFSNCWQMFSALRFLLGLTIGGFLAVGVPYTTEFMLPSKRAAVSIIPSFNVGTCLMALVAWRVQDWRMIHWLGGAITFPLCVGFFILPESLRWLAVHGRVEEADKTVRWIAGWNKQEVPKDSIDIIKSVAEGVRSSGPQTHYTYLHIYKGFKLFKTSIVLQTLWAITNMCAYGLSFGASAFGDMYLNIFLMAVVTLPSMFVLGLIVNRLGRKRTAVLGLLLSSACGFGSLLVKLYVSDTDKQELGILVLNMLNRAFQAIGSSAVMITTNEVYPTVIRALGFGAANTTGRIGGILAPFALNFQDNPLLGFGLTGGALLVAALGVLLLDETTGKAMQDTLVSVPGNQGLELKLSRLDSSGMAEDNKYSPSFQNEIKFAHKIVDDDNPADTKNSPSSKENVRFAHETENSIVHQTNTKNSPSSYKDAMFNHEKGDVWHTSSSAEHKSSVNTNLEGRPSLSAAVPAESIKEITRF